MPARSPVLLVGNHLSYVDICTVLTTKAVSFVAKAELQKWPIIGEAAKRAGIIFVKREEKSSRTHALTSVRQYLKRTQGSLCIFPSGTTHLTEARPWRYGPFQIAKSLGIPVQPFRIAYNQMRKVAYIDKDNFALHLWQLLDSEKLSVTIEFAEPFEVDNPEADAAYWWQWSRYPLLAANLAEKDGNL